MDCRVCACCADCALPSVAASSDDVRPFACCRRCRERERSLHLDPERPGRAQQHVAERRRLRNHGTLRRRCGRKRGVKCLTRCARRAARNERRRGGVSGVLVERRSRGRPRNTEREPGCRHACRRGRGCLSDDREAIQRRCEERARGGLAERRQRESLVHGAQQRGCDAVPRDSSRECDGCNTCRHRDRVRRRVQARGVRAQLAGRRRNHAAQQRVRRRARENRGERRVRPRARGLRRRCWRARQGVESAVRGKRRCLAWRLRGCLAWRFARRPRRCLAWAF